MNKVIIKWQGKNYFLKYTNYTQIKSLYKTNQFKKYCQYLEKKGTAEVPLGKWTKTLADTDIVIFFDSMLSDKAIDIVKYKNPNTKIYLFFWNSINENNKHLLNKNKIDKFYTFDKKDAEKYNINYKSQFYSNQIKLKNKPIKYDICFLGRDKGRKELISKIEKQLIKNNITYDIRVIEQEKDFISYKKYLKMLERSRCILEITANNQTGLSLRAMESLFLSRKLITNNKYIKDYDFYKKENIFIIGQDNWNELASFINTEYVNIDKDIIEKYNFENWLKEF